MKKVIQYGDQACREALAALGRQWQSNIAETAKHMKDHPDHLGTLRTFFEAAKILESTAHMRGALSIVAMFQHELPDYDSDDREYGSMD